MNKEKAILAGGCFWGMQDLIRKMDGVLETRVGYTGGDVPNATYRNHGTHAEAIEIVALETSDLVNKPLRDIKFPKGAIIGAVVKDNDIIIPTGDTTILPGDRVIIFSLTSAIPSVEKTLMVKMEYW